jgi:transposase
MASLQPRSPGGKTKYWSIVESRRVNGKPVPFIVEYLGTADNLLERLRGEGDAYTIRSYEHGTVAALLSLAHQLDIPALINRHVASPRRYMPRKPLRNGLTAGMTLLLGALGRVCMPTSKRGWWEWARETSCAYLLGCPLRGIDSQHFWDLMDALPVEALEPLEAELLARLQALEAFDRETLLFDTTNFFTYIATTNERCTIAQRGKNKQKRADLRQVGLALAVTRHDGIPLFHLSYEGNRHDSPVFAEVLAALDRRLRALDLDTKLHTLVFDRGNNSKANLDAVEALGLHYVGALTPYQHAALVECAQHATQPIDVQGRTVDVYRDKHVVWGRERTVLVFVSDRLKAGQWRGIHQTLHKKEEALRALQAGLRAKPRPPEERAELDAQLASLAKGQFLRGIISYEITNTDNRLQFEFNIDKERLAALEDELGFRILMTSRHEWSTPAIIETFYGQADVERAFKDVKNPHHLAIRPQFHWTNQKIRVHFFMCVLGYTLATVLLRQAREKAGFTGSMDTLLDWLRSIRLSAKAQRTGKRGKPRLTYKLEQSDPEKAALFQALELEHFHLHRPKFNGVSVYAEH